MRQEKIAAVIEARMSSSRLPGKVLLPAGGKAMLEHLIDRLKRVEPLEGIVLATTTGPIDEPLVSCATKNRIACFRGSEEDVMSRVIGAAEAARCSIIVSVTGDCPIIDPLIVEQIIRMFLNNDCDYASNAHVRSYPDGMDTQVYRLETLKRSSALTNSRLDREHVTLHIRNHPELFRQVHLVAPPDEHWPELGLTLDQPEDYELLKKIIEHFGPARPYFSCREVIRLLRERPDWVRINSAVRRRGDT